MKQIGGFLSTADWKTEKHVPVLECPDKVKRGELFSLKATIGKEIARPNTTENHMRRITIYFQPENDKFPYEVGHFDFSSHGESADGPNRDAVYAHHEVTTSLKISRSGTIYATSMCNIRGLWQSVKEIKNFMRF